jgi:hypothetical protein
MDLVATSRDSAEIEGRESMPPALRIMHDAMQRRGLNAPKLASSIRVILRRQKQAKVKVDRTTIYRIMDGKTKRPNPEIAHALIEALELSEKDATIVRKALSDRQKS